MRFKVFHLVSFALLAACAPQINYTQYVDPMVGTDAHGHVFLGANVPFGAVQVGPSQTGDTWDWCSGYHYSDSTIIGFAHTHLSGTGCGDLGDIVLAPRTNDKPYSLFRHETEVAKAGYYKVRMDSYGADVELTATARCGFHKYHYDNPEEARVVVNLERGVRDKVTDCHAEQVGPNAVCGYRTSTGWAKNHTCYFYAEFSKSITSFKVETPETPENPDATGELFSFLTFDMGGGSDLYVKVGISPNSTEAAKANLAAEIPGWNFKKVVKDADAAWNAMLSKIDVESDDIHELRKFYSAFYHTMFNPCLYSDTGEKNVYTVFSLWDTYRAFHPLMTIVHPEMLDDVARSMVDVYKECGILPVWHLAGCETYCMAGNPAIPVLADIILKGYCKDVEGTYEAMKNSAMADNRYQKYMRDYGGYIPFDEVHVNRTVSHTQEYAIADWSLGQVAGLLGKTEDYEYFDSLSKGYRKMFDPQLQFVRGLSKDGRTFSAPFDPFHAHHNVNDYMEGTAWQYTWLAPHDVQGLIDLFGSKESFITKLDSLFVVSGFMGERASKDISGLIGQYAHGNEPSHHIAYLYDFVGQQYKAAEKVRHICTTLYTDEPVGLCGNEDAGQMSAWYIISSMGFYQVEPCGGRYYFGSPCFRRMTVNVGGGKKLEIIAHDNSDENIYIQRIKLNGEDYDKLYIEHKDIVAGGCLEFFMGSEPVK